MTITNPNNRQNYVGDGATVLFAFNYRTDDPTWITVLEFDEDSGQSVERTDVTIVVNADQEEDPGGTVTFGTAPELNANGTFLRVVPIDQGINYLPYDKFPAETSEFGLDKLTMIDSQIQEQLNRAILSDPTDPDPSSLQIPSFSGGAYWRWHESDPGRVVNGWTEPFMDLRFSPTVHPHPISDVAGLQPALDSKASIGYVDSENSGQDSLITANASAISSLQTGKADDNAVLKLTGSQTATGIKTFTSAPRSAATPEATTDLSNKAYVDQIFDSLTGVIFKGVQDASTGDGGLDPSPSNGDVWYIGVGGDLTVSDGSGPAGLQTVEVGGRIVWSQGDNYWLYLSPTAAGGAVDIVYDNTGTNFTGTNVQSVLDEVDVILTNAVDLLVPKSGGSFEGLVAFEAGARLNNAQALSALTSGAAAVELIKMSGANDIEIGDPGHDVFFGGAETFIFGGGNQILSVSSLGVGIAGLAELANSNTSAASIQRKDQLCTNYETTHFGGDNPSQGVGHTTRYSVTPNVSQGWQLDPRLGPLSIADDTLLINTLGIGFAPGSVALNRDFTMNVLFNKTGANTLTVRNDTGGALLMTQGVTILSAPGWYSFAVTKMEDIYTVTIQKLVFVA